MIPRAGQLFSWTRFTSLAWLLIQMACLGQVQIPDKRFNPDWIWTEKRFDYGIQDDLRLLEIDPQYPFVDAKSGVKLALKKRSFRARLS